MGFLHRQCCPPCHPLHLLVQPEPYADEPVQGGVGVDEGVEGLVAFTVALGLPGADRASALEAGDDALGGQLAEIVGVEALGEVDRTGAGLGQFFGGRRWRPSPRPHQR